ncbi:uncharacterized protein LOC120414901 isoform X2 [Culex pipiens pallens]|uniref:uncharacterized protein LOC120414901 isoform X2 n=1 Tax=Culex pipiens pallens TaxID=42434 RepID=UPI001953B6BD|nr:uncharacterized protein LOC120414901 isoform X2 [Culex pipiens pallens]
MAAAVAGSSIARITEVVTKTIATAMAAVDTRIGSSTCSGSCLPRINSHPRNGGGSLPVGEPAPPPVTGSIWNNGPRAVQEIFVISVSRRTTSGRSPRPRRVEVTVNKEANAYWWTLECLRRKRRSYDFKQL